MSPTDVEPSDTPIVSLGTYKGRLPPHSSPESPEENDTEEGTPQDIRRRFFPSAPIFDP